MSILVSGFINFTGITVELFKLQSVLKVNHMIGGKPKVTVKFYFIAEIGSLHSIWSIGIKTLNFTATFRGDCNEVIVLVFKFVACVFLLI